MELVDTTPTTSFMHTVPFWPEVRLAWHLNLVNWIVHWPALPQVCLDLTWICILVQTLCHLPATALGLELGHHRSQMIDQMIPGSWIHQVELLMTILFHIEYTLAQNICLDRLLTSQHVREHARRRSELCRSDGTLWGALWQKTTDRHYWTVRPATWTASLQQILQLLRLYGRPDDNAGTPLFEARGYAQCHVHGQIVHSVPAMWERQSHAIDVASLQGLAPQSSERRSDSAAEAIFVSHPHRRAFETGTHVEARCTRRRVGEGLRTRQILTPSIIGIFWVGITMPSIQATCATPLVYFVRSFGLA